MDNKDKPKKPKKAKNKPRNMEAVDAWFRGSAGPMKDRRKERGGAKNWKQYTDD